MASSDAIRSALVRLCKDGDIIRVAQGIYCYPKIDTIWVRKKIATSMNYQDIEKLASLKESNNLEFKESTGQLDRSMETLCAFLNCEGGTILYGVKDNGKIIGQ